MTVKDYVKQFTNEALAREWNNNIPAHALEHLDYLCLDSQDLDFICEYFTFLPREEITGYLGSIRGGDYAEIYVTESARPHDLQAIYHPLEYYL